MNLNTDFKKGFWVGLGVGAALILISVAGGILRKV
jgi:hypothetical protein